MHCKFAIIDKEKKLKFEGTLTCFMNMVKETTGKLRLHQKDGMQATIANVIAILNAMTPFHWKKFVPARQDEKFRLRP